MKKNFVLLAVASGLLGLSSYASADTVQIKIRRVTYVSDAETIFKHIAAPLLLKEVKSTCGGVHRSESMNATISIGKLSGGISNLTIKGTADCR